MDKYFEIKADCELYKEYFAHKADEPKIINAFDTVREKFGIETSKFYMFKNSFHIVPTKNDIKKFDGVMKKSNYGEFKKNSEPSKMWRELTKDIEHFQKPRLLLQCNLLGHHWKERLFDIENRLYCSIESDGEVSVPDFAIEMNASEIYMIIEDYEESEAQ